MVDRAIIEEILAAAVNAPSGDNAQPWEFVLDGALLSIYNVERDATIYNHRQRGSYLAHGALVENIVLRAADHGFSVEVRPFPGNGRTAELRFIPNAAKPDPLSRAIESRTTNRKPYRNERLSAADRTSLLESGTFFGCEIQIVESDERKALIAQAVGANEKLLFEHRGLHSFLFSMIRWSEAESAQPGLYVMTMEFPAPLRFLLRRVFSHWTVIEILNRIGLSSFISKQSTATHAASAAFGAITISGKTDTDYFNAGRTFERLWLTATERGISLQPVTAMPYLLERVREGEADMFSESEQARIREAGEAIESGIECGDRHIAMLFRVGYCTPPTAHSGKLPPVFR